jgi:RHH-type proline utilization regulon transcriptional repressor/proline dehydrogenase/delta 1-pyrroline-5-carboxylate dehydrogenase
MRAASLRQAIEWVNATGYGLTSGLQSLDEREQEAWRDGIKAGNLYLNRPTTGAIVLRQPFGGMGKSAFGPGIKAGGPNYLIPFMRFSDAPGGAVAPPADPTLVGLLQAAAVAGVDADQCAQLSRAFASYERWMRDEFGRAHETARLVGEDNLRRYLPVDRMVVRIADGDTDFDTLARIGAALCAGTQLAVSAPPGRNPPALAAARSVLDRPGIPTRFVTQSDAELAAAIAAGEVERIRYASSARVPAAIYSAAASTLVYLARTPVLAHGRIELLWYFREQSVSHAYHRYGNLGARAAEPREPVA